MPIIGGIDAAWRAVAIAVLVTTAALAAAVILVDWDLVLWQAWATLASGLLAVSGAAFIAKRQLAITGRQADIQERQASIADRQASIQSRQVELQQLTLKRQLFDDRMKIYDQTVSFLHAAVRTRRMPAKDEQRAYLMAVAKSRFLFRPEVPNALSEIYSKVEAAEEAWAGSSDAGVPINAAALNAAIKWLDAAVGRLHSIFADDMLLTEATAPSGP